MTQELFLNRCPILKFDNDEEWHAVRKKGIGGSDAAGVLGFSKYKNKHQLWIEKCSEGCSVNKIDSRPMRLGRNTEVVVLEELKVEYPDCEIFKPEFGIAHPEYPYIRVNLDGIMTHPDGTQEVIEIKCTGYKWKEIPVDYYFQIQHELLVTGLQSAKLVVLENMREFKIIPVIRNEEHIEWMLDEYKEFWSHVESNTCPEIYDDDITEDILKQIYSRNTKEIVANLPSSLYTIAEQWIEHKKMLKQIETQLEEYSKQIEIHMQDHTIGIITHSDGRSFKIKWPKPRKQFDESVFKDLYSDKIQDCLGFDKTKAKMLYSEEYNKCMTEGSKRGSLSVEEIEK